VCLSFDTPLCPQVRKKLDPEFKSQNPPQNVFAMSAAYATYMASSSNLRYQVRPLRHEPDPHSRRQA